MHSILHIGAGKANNLPQMLNSGAEQITLVEPNPKLAEQLRQRTAQHSHVTVVEAAITSNAANNKLQEYNLPEASSLYQATGLKTLYPGLKIIATHTVATLSPDQLLAKHGPRSGEQAMLAIHAPGEEHALLQTLMSTDQLKQFSELRVNANPTPYFEGGEAAEKTLQALVDYGYQISDNDLKDPDWPSWQLARDPMSDEIKTLQAENKKLMTSTEQLEEALTHSQQEKVLLEELNEQLKQKLAQESETNKELNLALAIANRALDAQLSADSKIDDLEKKIVDIGNNLTNHLDENQIKTVNILENTLGLQNYFNTGELPINQYGWSINTDLAMYLVEKMKAEKYDLVIEFGSGNSTALFAKVLMKIMSNQKQTALEQTAFANDSKTHKRIFTFEHNAHYYERTAAMLQQADLENMVDLLHTPLVEYSYSGEDYLYYDCDSALSTISEHYKNRMPKILVLVDGPPGDTGIHARFPALPKLLKHLTTATFDLILDDYKREEEKAVAENWINILNERTRSYTKQEIPLEKGAICISIGAPASQSR